MWFLYVICNLITTLIHCYAGGDAELTCRIQNENREMKYPVLWMRLANGKNPAPLPISSGDELLLTSDRRFKLEVDEDESSYTIQP